MDVYTFIEVSNETDTTGLEGRKEISKEWNCCLIGTEFHFTGRTVMKIGDCHDCTKTHLYLMLSNCPLKIPRW